MQMVFLRFSDVITVFCKVRIGIDTSLHMPVGVNFSRRLEAELELIIIDSFLTPAAFSVRLLVYV